MPSRIQSFLDKLVREEYREFDLRTLTPSKLSSLPLERQAEELEILKKAPGDNYFFIGPPGTSKSTFSTALLRESLWRNKQWVKEYWWAQKSSFCWKVNAENLFVQNMTWKTSRSSETPPPTPDVTPEKIDKAKAKGLRPTLIIEELDKTKLTDSRVNFLFDIIDAMDGCRGQIIITSNRTLDRFLAMFEEHTDETVRVTGGPLMRRLLKNCNVRNYFE
jgi:septin family protein